MVAALKFFLGQDQDAEDDSDAENDEDDIKALQPSKAEVYKANSKVGHLFEPASACRRLHYMLKNMTLSGILLFPVYYIRWLEQSV